MKQKNKNKHCIQWQPVECLRPTNTFENTTLIVVKSKPIPKKLIVLMEDLRLETNG